MDTCAVLKIVLSSRTAVLRFYMGPIYDIFFVSFPLSLALALND